MDARVEVGNPSTFKGNVLISLNQISEIRSRADEVLHDVLHVIVGRHIGRKRRPRRRQIQVRAVLNRDLCTDGLVTPKSVRLNLRGIRRLMATLRRRTAVL